MERQNNTFKIFTLRHQIAEAKRKLSAKDYVGRKIAEVLLLGTEAEITAIKQEYSSVIAEAKTLRDNINTWEAEIKTIREQMKSNQK
jgi:chromosome segregation ATPase